MRFGWGKVAGLAMLGLLTACGRGGEGETPGAEAERAAEFFLASNGRAEGITTLPSGLQYKVLASGPANGPRPDRNDLVRVDYEGALTDGSVFDSSFSRGQPMVTAPEGIPAGTIIPAWTEILQLMRPGDEWVVYVPPALGYGEQGRPPVIPGHSVLVFRIKLLAVAPTPGAGSAPDQSPSVGMG